MASRKKIIVGGGGGDINYSYRVFLSQSGRERVGGCAPTDENKIKRNIHTLYLNEALKPGIP